MDEEIARAFAAAADTVLPGSSAKGIHEKVAGLFDGALPGYSVMVIALLDAFASDVRAGVKFADLSDEERSEVFKLMMAEESVDIQDVLDGLMLFTMGQNYSENNPGHVEAWKQIGYHGPSEGIPNYA
jgi:hypothetical protein